jgi:hypothetical protein
MFRAGSTPMREISGTTKRVIRAAVVQPLQRIRVASPWMLVEPLPSEEGIYLLSS